MVAVGLGLILGACSEPFAAWYTPALHPISTADSQFCLGARSRIPTGSPLPLHQSPILKTAGEPLRITPEKGGGARGGASPVGENRASLPTTRGPAGVAASHPAAPLAEPAVSPARPEPLQARGSRR